MPTPTVLRYPYEAITDTTDYLQITIRQYVRNGLISPQQATQNSAAFATITNTQNVSTVPSSVAQLTTNGIILLPMPSNIQDGNSVGYGDDTINSYAAAAVGTVKDVLDDSGKLTITDNLKMLTGETALTLSTYINDPEAIKALNRYFAASAVNIFGANVTPDQLLARSSGQIFNPNMELLFNGVTLRSFRFSFKMTPRDENESLQVKSIIRSLKKNMAPKSGLNSNFLETPNIFELVYRKGNSAHPFLHKFKQCALTDMSVNYTGENVYATYADGTPISVIMDLTFKELAPIYDTDYADATETNLTYNANGGTYGVGY